MLSDPAMVLTFLDADGLLPSGFKDVVMQGAGGHEGGRSAGLVGTAVEQGHGLRRYLSGDVFEGSFFGVSPDHSPPSSQINVEEYGAGGPDEPAVPPEAFDDKLLDWTQTAITVLNLLATVTGESFFAEAATILTKLVQIYKNIRALIDSIQAIVDTIDKVANATKAAG